MEIKENSNWRNSSMWFRKITQKKVQMFLTGIMLFSVAGMLNMSLCLVGELASFAKQAINERNCPSGYIFTIGTKNFEDHFIDDSYLSSIEAMSGLSGKATTVPILYNDFNIARLHDTMLSATNWRDFGYLELVMGNADIPNEGEVWLSEVLTKQIGMKLGDKIIIKYSEPLELSVSGFYRSTCFPKGIGYSHMLVNPADLTYAQNEDDASFFAVNIKEYSDYNMRELFKDSLYSVDTRTRDDVRRTMMEYSGPLGATVAIASVIVIIITMVILRYVVRNNLMKEFNTIGVYKSLGYSTKEISRFYSVGYMLVGAVSIIIGIFCSLGLVLVIGDMLTEYVQPFSLTNTALVISFTTFFAVMILLYANLKFSFRKVREITPIKAINLGSIKAEKKLPQPLIKNAKTPTAMAINELFKYKRTSAMTVLSISMLMFLSMFLQMIWYSTDKMQENRNLWFCLPKSDVFIVGNLNDDLQKALRQSSYVDNVIYGDFMIGYCKLADTPDYVGYDAYSNYDEDITGVRMVSGVGPQSKNEVAVGTSLLATLNLSINDPLSLIINGVTKEYIISGAYETITSGGKKIMLTTETVAECKDYAASRAFVWLNSKDNFENLKLDIESRFADVAVDQEWFAIQNSTESIQYMIMSISMLLLISFVVFSMLNVAIVLSLDMKNWRRKFGIMKSLGFNANYIIRQNGIKYLIIAIVSSVFSLFLHGLFSQKIIAALVLDAFSSSIKLVALITLSFIVLIEMTTYIISSSVRKISPLELMEE